MSKLERDGSLRSNICVFGPAVVTRDCCTIRNYQIVDGRSVVREVSLTLKAGDTLPFRGVTELVAD